MSEITISGIFFPAPGKRAETGMSNPHALFIKNPDSTSSRALIFEPDAVLNLPNSFSNSEMVELKLDANALCQRKYQGIYLTEPIGIAVNQMDTDFTFTHIPHSSYH